MTESRFGQERTERFGLAEVGGAVSDYYDLLFDNVQEFIGINREELREYEAANAELEKTLENSALGDAERQALTAEKEKNQGQIEALREFMGSSRILEKGIELSGEILDDNEPELTDRFNAAPVTEKYACLVLHYMDEYRTGVEARVNLAHKSYTEASVAVDSHRSDRPSAWDTLTSLGAARKHWAERLEVLDKTADGKKKDWENLKVYVGKTDLVDGDAFRQGVEKTKEFFPEVVKEMDRHWEEANTARLERQKERQAEREGGNEISPDNGLSR
jgi:hypothetical protein